MVSLCISAIIALPPFFWIWGSYGQPSGALWGDQLFVAVTAKAFGQQRVLYRGKFTPAARRVNNPFDHDNPSGWAYGSTQAKLQIRDDRLMLSSGCGGYVIISLNKVHLLENSSLGLKKFSLGSYSQFIFPHVGLFNNLLFPAHRKPDVPVSETGRDEETAPSERTYWLHARYDAEIKGKKSVWLFHAYKDTLFVSAEPNYLNEWYWDDEEHAPKKNLPPPPARQLRKGRLPSDFTEQFRAYTSGDYSYLVTPNGKIYMVAPKSKTEVEVSTVWNDPKRRIVGIVRDTATDTVYGWGFVTTSAAPERFYVKMEPKPVAVNYKLTVPLWSERSDAYLESYECARAFRMAMAKK